MWCTTLHQGQFHQIKVIRNSEVLLPNFLWQSRSQPSTVWSCRRSQSNGFSPHLCVGFLFLILYPASSPPPPPASAVTHLLSHTTLSHTIFYTHTPSLSTIFANHHLSHTIFHTPSLTHIFVNHHLSHTIFYTPSFTHHLLHTHTHTIFHTHLCQPPSSTLRGRRGTWSHPPSFCVAGGALMALGWLWWCAWAGISRRWRRATLRGRRGTWWHVPYGIGLALVARLGWD